MSWLRRVLPLAASLFALFPLAAFAQSAAPAPAGAPPPQAPAAAPSGSPPAVVGWLAQSSGTIWVTEGSGRPWRTPLQNQPLAPGSAIATAPNGHAMIEVMSMRAALGPNTELAVGQLSPQGGQLSESTGSVALDLRALPQGASVAVDTPHGAVEIATPGEYEITSDPTQMIVSAASGGARIEGNGTITDVGPGQAATLTRASFF